MRDYKQLKPSAQSTTHRGKCGARQGGCPCHGRLPALHAGLVHCVEGPDPGQGATCGKPKSCKQAKHFTTNIILILTVGVGHAMLLCLGDHTDNAAPYAWSCSRAIATTHKIALRTPPP